MEILHNVLYVAAIVVAGIFWFVLIKGMADELERHANRDDDE